MNEIHNELNERISVRVFTEDYNISQVHVSAAIYKLKPNNNDVLTTNHMVVMS